MKIDYNDYDPRYRMSWAIGIMQRYDGDHGDPEEAAKEICQLCDAHMEAHKPAHAAQPVGEWVTGDEWSAINRACLSAVPCGNYLKEVNALLTKKYGHPPIVRTYNPRGGSGE